jgi:hypothetical protein
MNHVRSAREHSSPRVYTAFIVDEVLPVFRDISAHDLPNSDEERDHICAQTNQHAPTCIIAMIS